MFSILNCALSWAITSFGNKFCPKKRSRLIKALNNRFYVKFMQLEIGLLQTGFHFWVRQLRFQFWVKLKSGNCGRFQFWSYSKMETADTFPVLGSFHFWACTKVFNGKNQSVAWYCLGEGDI